jgi:cytochrome c oxidase cbb3-type subunit IV
MKFIHYLESITGIAIFPLISLLLFFLFFTLLILFVVKADKEHINALKQLPLDGTTTDHSKKRS